MSVVEADWEELRRAAVRQAAGVGVATGAYGVSFGALATTGGLNVMQACALSALMFTGASQFAFVGVVAAAGNPLSGAATAVLLGSRNALYGLRLAGLLGVRRTHKAVAAQLVIDESTAVALGQPTGRSARLGFWATGLAVYLLWNAATFVGALGGDALGDPERYGLDAAAPAAFVALLAPRMRGRDAWLVGIAAAVVALAVVPVLPAGLPVLAAGLVAVVVGALRPRTEQPTSGAPA